MTVTAKRSLIALFLSLVLVVSLFTVNVAAATEAEGTSAEVESVTEKVTGTEKETTKKEEVTTESAAEKAEREQREETITTLIINGAIIAAIILIIVIVAIKFRVKLGAFLRSVKSELKKIVWTSKENTRKGFLVVAIVAVAFAIALGLMDFAFQTGISSLAELFK
ncbi:MAG: preprotein translocase subunit SecE [Clostridia bacterium]|nr:preprotein translocase subunit SecE [Clostridia bacterium]